jgi:hypothetical protein
MRASFVSIIGAGLISIASVWFFAAGNNGVAADEPATPGIQSAIKEHLVMQTDANGNINVNDPATGTMLKLEYVKVHDQVKKNGDSQSICVDFVDRNTMEKVDIDYEFQQQEDGSIKVTNSKVHKINDKEL